MATLTHLIFYVEALEPSIRFFEEAFGIKAAFVHESNMYAELETGSTRLAFAAEDLGSQNLPDGFLQSRKDALPLGAEIVLTVSDVQASYDQATQCGGEPLVPPNEKPWGQTVAYVRDPNGLLIEIASIM